MERLIARRIGVLGGTFDPVHVGHLVAAEEARAALRLDEVVFVPAGDPPHKVDRALAPAEDRVAMIEAAIAGHEPFRVSRIDVERPGPHFTVDMLRIARCTWALGASDRLWFVMGADSLADLPTWRDPARIVRLARLAVLERPGFAPDLDALEGAVPGVRAAVDRLAMPAIGISGTELRLRVAGGRTIRFQVPSAVEAHICREGLYASDEAAGRRAGEERPDA